ncbi:MAG: cell envelope integrity EipB family protein [Rhodospirillales bacterium]|nr:cell envelope integrity EipB family protein [Rhodospirillales bacterium]
MRICWGRIALLVFCLVMTGQAFAAEIVNHRAHYNVSLKSVQNKAGLVGVKGTTDFYFNDVCNGWVIENFSKIQFHYGDGQIIDTTWNFSAWESKDGKRFRFNVRQTHNGKETKDIIGTINRGEDGAAGKAILERPEETEIEFPKGTVFPTHHTLGVIAAAQKGEPLFNRVIFDGGGMDNPFEVNAVIGKSSPKLPLKVKGGDAFEAERAWKVNMAYFKTTGQAALPEYEMGLNYREDGIALQIDQNFMDFVLKAELKSIEKLPKPDC